MNADTRYPQASPVVRTQLDFKLDQVPRFWFGGDPYLTRMFDALSLTFPDGERYFIECVRLFRDQIADPSEEEQRDRSNKEKINTEEDQHKEQPDHSEENIYDADPDQKKEQKNSLN